MEFYFEEKQPPSHHCHEEDLPEFSAPSRKLELFQSWLSPPPGDGGWAVRISPETSFIQSSNVNETIPLLIIYIKKVVQVCPSNTREQFPLAAFTLGKEKRNTPSSSADTGLYNLFPKSIQLTAVGYLLLQF